MDRDELLRIRDHMAERGPDGSGAWFSADNRVGLGHRRLAIIDLSDAGAQPMATDDENLIVTFNGEIYNYLELRSSLERKGYRFRSNSDTEVLLHLYAEKGEEMLNDLRGMYAFAIWDERKKGMFLARDPFGIKPLYYSDDGKILRVSSQVRALLAGRAVDTTCEPAGHVGFFLWGHIPEPYTLFKGIKSLPAGCSLWVDSFGVGRLRAFCSISDELAKACDSPPEKLEAEAIYTRLRGALRDSVRHHLIADVPVAVFLSSGLDSTTLTALSSEIAPGSINTITLGFRQYRGTVDDEVPLAELVAKHYDTIHQVMYIEKDDFLAAQPRLLDAMDQPTVDGVNGFFICHAAARAGFKVAISGLGGDELFGSYPSFSQIPRMVNNIKFINPFQGIGKTFRFLSAPLLRRLTSPKYAGILEYGGNYGGAYLLRRGMFMPWELPNLLDGEVVKEGWRALQTLVRLEETEQGINNAYLKVSGLEMCWYMRNQLLRDCDWASMAHSLEVRVPLVDIELLRVIAPMLGKDRLFCKRDVAATAPSKSLPEEVLNRRKTGFSIPVREWLLGGGKPAGERGLRSWSKKVYSEHWK